MKMKIPIPLLLLFILFSLPGAKAQVMEKPLNIIVILMEGAGTSQITGALAVNKDSLNIQRFRQIGLMKNYTSAEFTPNIDYGIYPLATGKTTLDGSVYDSMKKNMTTIFHLARMKNRSTGLITTGNVYGTTLTPFYSIDPYAGTDIQHFSDLVNSEPQIVIGGGSAITNDPKSGNLVALARSRGLNIYADYRSLKKNAGEKVVILPEKSFIPRAPLRGEFLVNAWEKAYKSLAVNDRGYFLLIENPHMEWAARKNDWRYLVPEIIDVDKMLGKIFEYTDLENKTLVLVVTPYEVGGLTINDGNMEYNHLNPKWTNKSTTACLVPVFAKGPGAELFSGIYRNTDFYLKLKSLLE